MVDDLLLVDMKIEHSQDSIEVGFGMGYAPGRHRTRITATFDWGGGDMGDLQRLMQFGSRVALMSTGEAAAMSMELENEYQKKRKKRMRQLCDLNNFGRAVVAENAALLDRIRDLEEQLDEAKA